MFRRRNMLIVLAVVISLLNVAFLAYALTFKKPETKTPSPVANVLKKTTDITSSKEVAVDQTQKGKLLGTGQYAYAALDQSRITDGDPAQLAVITEAQSGSHFVMAIIGKDTKIPSEKLNSGWTVNTIAKDPMWAPGACSSKPTYLLQGKYIFIDDGKTNPTDKYNSYIVFDMATGKYNYFGGSSFTKDQGDKEVILKAVDENDKLVFYIDPVDSTGPLSGNTEGKHSKGSDHGYIIRREIDPATLKYTDYSLPFTVPTDINVYTIKWAYNDNELINLNSDGSDVSYDGKVTDNHLVLTKSVQTAYNPGTGTISDTQLELSLSPKLETALPYLSKQPPPSYTTSFKTKFSLNELGQNSNVEFLIAAQRYDSYSTPVVYNQSTGSVNVMTDSQIFKPYDNYVALGVF